MIKRTQNGFGQSERKRKRNHLITWSTTMFGNMLLEIGQMTNDTMSAAAKFDSNKLNN
jgi:hypothetical protein